MKKLVISTALASISMAFAGSLLLNEAESKNPQMGSTKINKFDLYILATEWIPGWCVLSNTKSSAELDNGRACQQQESKPLMYHGLWPEFNDGSYPASCMQVPELNPSKLNFANPYSGYLTNATSFLDHEWGKHGTCSNYYVAGLEIQDPTAYYHRVNHYFSSSIYLYQQIKLATLPLQLSVAELTQQIHSQNPQIIEASIIVRCQKDKFKQQYLSGLWFCLNKNVTNYISCPAEVLKTACKGSILSR